MGIEYSTTLGYGLDFGDLDDAHIATAIGVPDLEEARYEETVEQSLRARYPHLRMPEVGNSWSGEEYFIVVAESTYTDMPTSTGRVNQPDPTPEETAELEALAKQLPRGEWQETAWQIHACVF